MKDHAASRVVRDYLEAWAERDLEAAQRHLGEGFVMTYPGGASFTRLEDLVAHLTQSYRGVRKRFEGFDEVPAEAGTVVVYCFGTLYGEFADGRHFEGVRFIDRFTVRDGQLVDHRVWNDLPR
jgi:ketosteroid isomerase-like protein